MREFGGERVIRSLLRYSRLNARAIIATLPQALKRDAEEELYKNYMAKCLRLVTENTAKSSMQEAAYMPTDFEDIIHPKPKVEASDIIKDVFSRVGLKVVRSG